MPKVTIGIPFYNCEKYIINTIRSIYAQSFTNWEIIFIDDGSTDNSLSIVKSINDSRVKVISYKTNLGIGARRKEIVDLATEKYLAWQDADDMMHPDRLQIQYDFLEKHTDIDLVDNSTYVIDPALNVIRLSEKTCGIVDPSKITETPTMLNGSSMARLEMYKEFNFDSNLRRLEDWDVWIRASKHCVFYHLSDSLYYRLDADKNQKPRMDRELSLPKDTLKIYMKNGLRYLGLLKSLKLIIRLFVRTLYRVTFIALGQHKHFKSERTNTLSSKTKVIAEQGLQKILGTKIPGIDY